MKMLKSEYNLLLFRCIARIGFSRKVDVWNENMKMLKVYL